MKIALCQINPTMGDINGNKQLILDTISKNDADFFIFPELCLIGYNPGDMIFNTQLIAENLKALDSIAKQIGSKSALIGFADRKEDHVHNAAALVSNAELHYYYYKQCLPQYRVFDDQRLFTAGGQQDIMIFNGIRIGVSICEDLWQDAVYEQQAAQGVDMFITISASPFEHNKLQDIENLILEKHRQFKKPIVYVNQVGAQDGVVFYGNSLLVSNGKVVLRCKAFEQDIQCFTV